jgi:murein DD-endopeptidase MepM/ murein hydrolase activator NlpD
LSVIFHILRPAIAVFVMLLLASVNSCGSLGLSSTDDCAQDTLENDLTNIEYGFVTDSFIVVRDQIQRNQNLSSILMPFQVPMSTIDQLARASKEVFDLRKLSAGRPYTIFCSKDESGVAQCFIYEVNATDYVVFDLRDSLHVYMASKPMETVHRHIKGVINSSLYATLQELGAEPALAIALSEIYAWTIDFYRIQKGDEFDVLYEEYLVEGKSIGNGKILSSTFSKNGKPIRAYYFEHGEEKGYYDNEGNSLRRAFLKAPVKFSRISSGYSTARLHPVLKTVRPHFGTDYAAPTGTPIMSVGDGTVTEAKYSGGNGNYVKIRHNSAIETQYLHMSKFAAGIRPGKRVSQGDIIGYVGSTGLATGPHVCFRFWKNGKQVDHRKEELPSSGPVPATAFADFQNRMAYLDSLASVRQVIF